MSNIENKDVTEQSNKRLILASAAWCGPCFGLKKRLEESNLYNKIEIKDADKDRAFFKDHNIKAIPVLLIFDEENNAEFIQGVADIYKAISAHVVG